VNAPPTGSLRLVLCDDYQMLAQALAAALQARGHQVLCVTTDPATCVAAVAVHDPDICILDVHFPGEDSGLKAARLIRQHHLRTKVLMLSGVADTQTLAEAVEIGVAGLIPKDQGVDEIAEALQVVAIGGAVFGRGLLHGVLSPGMRKPQSNDPFDALAPREKEVLARIVEGQSTKQMARAMSISNGTVRIYIRNVLTALGAHSRLEVAAIARREGMLNRPQAGGANLTRAGLRGADQHSYRRSAAHIRRGSRGTPADGTRCRCCGDGAVGAVGSSYLGSAARRRDASRHGSAWWR
jgi:two-component system, NarL family, nitrate/nitrite response regulator NarL